jgi:hypothetical protein
VVAVRATVVGVGFDRTVVGVADVPPPVALQPAASARAITTGSRVVR